MASLNATKNPHLALEGLIKIMRDCGADLSGFNITALRLMDTNSTEYKNNLNKMVLAECQYVTPSAAVISPKSAVSSTFSTPSPVLITYYAFVMFFGLFVNLCVIGTIFRVRRLWSITNSFVLSLSFADLLMVGLVVPMYIKDLYHPRSPTAPVLDTMFPLLGVASLLSLGAVTVDRFLSITRPLRYDSYLNTTRASTIILLIWMVSVFQAVLLFAFRDDQASETLYQDLRFALAFSLPFICVILVNGRIFCVARKHARQINMADPSTRNSSNRGFIKKTKTAKVIGLLVGAFVVSWLPYFVLTICELHLEPSKVIEDARAISTAIVCGTALFNPLLYGMLRKDVREAIIRGLKCQNINHIDMLGETNHSIRSIRTARTANSTAKAQVA